MSITKTAPDRRIGTLAIVALTVLILAVFYQFWGVVRDTALVLGYRFGVDYGEGIVWQQALLMFGPRMYSPSPELPFVVFHYTPLYHFIVRGLMALGWDPLLAGRLVSVVGSVISALTIGALILAGTRRPRNTLTIGVAVTVAVMFLSLPAIRSWGNIMRVDMLAVSLGLLGTTVFVISRCSTSGTIVALLICVASLFVKQTQLPAGVAVFVVALACAPRTALIAALSAGIVGLACVATLELATGGFLKNIISYNINPFKLNMAVRNVWHERDSAPVILVMLLALYRIGLRFSRENGWARLRERDQRSIVELVICLHFVLACFSAVEILKDGGANNYFLDLLASGCILIGIALCDVATRPLFLSLTAVLALATVNLRHRYYDPEQFERFNTVSEQLVKQLAATDRPVSSDDMVLTMRAGKSLVFEPAIIRVLIAGGKWDPAPLLALIRNQAFAFMLTYDDRDEGESGPVITRAIRDAYPRREELPLLRTLTANYPS